MKLLVFGGTTEGRILAEILSKRGYDVTVSVATEVGAEELKDISCQILCGRKSCEEIELLVPEYDTVIDATHPYSQEVTLNIRNACKEKNIPLKRVYRQESELAGDKLFPDIAAVTEFLRDKQGNVLIATGSKELKLYSKLNPERLFPRVLPTHEGIRACEEIRVPHKNIIAMQGPFTKEMNEATVRQYNIRWMVTRDSGKQGGFAEKQEAAIAAGAELLIVARPDRQGISMEKLLEEFKEG